MLCNKVITVAIKHKIHGFNNMTKHTSQINLMTLPVNEHAVRSAAIAYAGRRIARFFKQLARAIRHRRQIAALAKLDERTLHDIGLSRSDVQDAMSQPLWARRPAAREYWRHGDGANVEALASLDDNQICNLSELGQRLRREARRARQSQSRATGPASSD